MAERQRCPSIGRDDVASATTAVDGRRYDRLTECNLQYYERRLRGEVVIDKPSRMRKGRTTSPPPDPHSSTTTSSYRSYTNGTTSTYPTTASYRSRYSSPVVVSQPNNSTKPAEVWKRPDLSDRHPLIISNNVAIYYGKPSYEKDSPTPSYSSSWARREKGTPGKRTDLAPVREDKENVPAPKPESRQEGDEEYLTAMARLLLEDRTTPNHGCAPESWSLSGSEYYVSSPDTSLERSGSAGSSPSRTRATETRGRWSLTKRNLVIRQMVSWLMPWLDSQLSRLEHAAYSQHGGQGSKQADSAAGLLVKNVSMSGVRAAASSSKSTQKRPAPEENGGSDDENEGQSFPKRPCIPQQPQLLLACPFFQREPDVYQNWRSCPGPGWPSCHRLKGHLYRSHGPPENQCHRCGETFKEDGQLADHLRSAVPCEIKETQPHLGFGKEQEKQLRKRSKPKNVQTELDYWAYIYGILFPGESVPSPFYARSSGSSEEKRQHATAFVSDFRAFAHLEFPRLMHQQLAPVFDAAIERVCGPQQLVAVAETVLEGILRNFEQAHGAASVTTAPEFEIEDFSTTAQVQDHLPGGSEDLEQFEMASDLQFDSSSFFPDSFDYDLDSLLRSGGFGGNLREDSGYGSVIGQETDSLFKSGIGEGPETYGSSTDDREELPGDCT